MNNNLHHQQFLFDHLKDHRSNKLSPRKSPNFSLDPDLLRELNARYLHDINATKNPNGNNTILDKNSFSTFRAEHYHQHTHTHEHNLNILTPHNHSLLNGNMNNSLLDKLSKSDNTLSPFLRPNFSTPSVFPSSSTLPPFSLTNNPSKENKSSKWCSAHVRICWMIYRQQQHSKDNKKSEEQSFALDNQLSDLISNTKAILPSASSDLSVPLPSTFLPPPTFNYQSPLDFSGVNNSPFGRVPFSSRNTFGDFGSLFSRVPTIDRKTDINGSRFHSNIRPSLSLKKVDETNNNESRKRSSAVVNNDDDRRNSYRFPPSHLPCNNRSRSRSPHSSSSSLLNKSCSSTSLSRKYTSSDNSISSTFDPLTLSIIERQRLSAAYASLIASSSQTKNYFPNTFDSTLFRNNNSSTYFPNLDSSVMTAALIQREHFINSLRLSQHEQIMKRQRIPTALQINRTSTINNEQISPRSNSSTSSKKSKHIKREKQSPSPTSTNRNNESRSKEESTSSS